MEKVIRYTIPSRYDVAPYGAIVTVMGDHEETMFIQLGQEEHSHWIRLGDFLEKAFKSEINDTEFIKGCLSLYEIK